MSDLATKTCVPCRGGVPPLKGEQLGSLQEHVDGWNVIEEHHITKAFTFPDFRGALTFVNRVGELAEEQGHHPDIFLAWGKVEISTWTHKINGLTESDFILAAKIDKLYKPLTPRHLTKSHNPLETTHSCYCPFSFTPSVPCTIVAFPPVCPTVPQLRGFGVRSVEVCDVA